MAAVWKRLQSSLDSMLPQLISRLQGSSKREAPENYRAVERRNGRIAQSLATHFGVEKRQFLHHEPSPSADPWLMVVNDLRYITDGVQTLCEGQHEERNSSSAANLMQAAWSA